MASTDAQGLLFRISTTLFSELSFSARDILLLTLSAILLHLPGTEHLLYRSLLSERVAANINGSIAPSNSGMVTLQGMSAVIPSDAPHSSRDDSNEIIGWNMGMFIDARSSSVNLDDVSWSRSGRFPMRKVTSFTKADTIGLPSLIRCSSMHSAMLIEPVSSLWREFVMIGTTPNPTFSSSRISSSSTGCWLLIHELLDTMSATSLLSLYPYHPRYSSDDVNILLGSSGCTIPCHGMILGSEYGMVSSMNVFSMKRNMFSRLS